MNDRQLRFVVDGLGGKANGTPREDGFDITVASEIMAVLCLATSISDLKSRLAKIIVGYTYDDKPVTAGELKAQGAMTALLKDAFETQSRADSRGHSRACSRRTFCKHRARVQQCDCNQNGTLSWRLRGHRGGFRRRPRCGEVFGHQVQKGANKARRGGCGGNRACAENARRLRIKRI